MKYTIKAHPTMYRGVQYRSRLEARWAAFFDLIEWQHEYEPIDLPGWSPDFRVVFPCGHSECTGSHSLLVEIKPYFDVKQFKGHSCLDFAYGMSDSGNKIPADASAGFGNNPEVSYWAMSHGAGGGEDCLLNWMPSGYSYCWSEAGNIVQWKPSNSSTVLPDFSWIKPVDNRSRFEKEIDNEIMNVIKAHRDKKDSRQ
jgi:hypothetical protein